MPGQQDIPFQHVQGLICSTPSTISISATATNTLTVRLQPLPMFEYQAEPLVFSWYWNFGEYVNGLKSSIRQEATRCILQLLGSAASIGITKWHSDAMPRELMRAFSKSWLTLMGVGDTGFLTERFKHRLRDLVFRAWRYAKNYARFEKQRISQWLVGDELIVAINC